MTTNCVVAVFDTMNHAQLAVHILERAGFAPDHVSLVTRHIPEGSQLEEELSVGDDAERDAVIGAALGGLAGVLGDAILFFITGLGAVVAAGPLALAAGAVIGGIIGAMEGWGIHHSHLRKYEDFVREGKVLLVVDGLPDELMEAENMLVETDASRSPSPRARPARTRRRSRTPDPAEWTRSPGHIRHANDQDALDSSLAEKLFMTTETTENARARLRNAVQILAEEKGGIKERLEVAYISQLSLIDHLRELPEDLASTLGSISFTLSTDECRGDTGTVAKELKLLSEDDASNIAHQIFEMFLEVYDLKAPEA